MNQLMGHFNPIKNSESDGDKLNLSADQYTKKEEIFQAHPYIDTKSNKMIGYGFKMDSIVNMLPRLVREGKIPLAKEEADKIFNKLYAKARKSAQSFVGDKWHSLNGQQQKALIDMAYKGKLNSASLKKAISNGDFHTASAHIMNSDHAKESPNRAQRNSMLIRS